MSMMGCIAVEAEMKNLLKFIDKLEKDNPRSTKEQILSLILILRIGKI